MQTFGQIIGHRMAQIREARGWSQEAELLDFLEYLLQKEKPKNISNPKTLPTVSVWAEEDFAYLENLKNNDNTVESW